MAQFVPPTIQDNPDGWGPTDLPEKFKDMPYQPFSKGDRLGKVSDWSGNTYQDRRNVNKYNSQFGGGNQYSYFHDEDESSFQLVDNTKVQKPVYQRNRFRFNQLRNRQMQQRQREAGGGQASQKPITKLEKRKERERQRLQRNMQKQYGQSRFRWKERQMQNQQKRRDASVAVAETWEVLEEMDFNRLSKLKLPDVGEPEDLYSCGELKYYDKSYDRVSVKAERPLKRINKEFHKVTTTDDPIIRRLAKSCGTVFATDAILATLMCSTRSQYSWDIIAQRVGKNKLFFDKRDDSAFDLLTVSETANEPPQDEGLNAPHNLSMEATYINHNFSQQVLKGGDKFKFANPNPFVQESSTGNVASVGYRYRKWNLGNNIELVARSEHDAVMNTATSDSSFINVKTLNEWDFRCCNGVEWRRKLDSQRGSVLATELKNNSCKLAKWTMCALLAGSEYLKMGYVSRYNIQDSSKHIIIGTQQFVPKEFASQINLSVSNAWGILRCVIDLCMKQPEGKYLLLKDPNKPVIRLYKLPEGTFSADEDSSDDEDDEEEEDEGETSSEDDVEK